MGLDSELLNDHITSGLVEGLNNKGKRIKRRAYGLRNFEHFRLRLLVECVGASTLLLKEPDFYDIAQRTIQHSRVE